MGIASANLRILKSYAHISANSWSSQGLITNVLVHELRVNFIERSVLFDLFTRLS